MSILPVANSEPAKPDNPSPATKPERPARPKKRGKNFNQIHAKPLPLEIHPLPAFHPSNPISLLRLAYTWISHILYPPASHPAEPYIGYFSPETRSVHITDPTHVRALWEMGFFGKGTLSRSEPNWLEREKARLRRERFGAEDATNARREERRMFKLERARVEAEKIERQRLVEEGKLDAESDARTKEDASMLETHEFDPNIKALAEEIANIDLESSRNQNCNIEHSTSTREPQAQVRDLQQTLQSRDTTQDEDDPEPSLQNKEHLQLTLEESFFLAYALGVLSIYPPQHAPGAFTPPMSPKSSPQPLTPHQLLQVFTQYTPFPPSSFPQDLAVDDLFLLHYATYHHFRSLGWVIRPGIKFGCDYLLYNRGPAFSHAEFAVIVIPAYSHRFWNTPGGRMRRRSVTGTEREGGKGVAKDWWWLHAVNRVQSQVKKTLVLCYVDVPSPWEVDLEGEGFDIGRLLRAYRVREFVVRRWVPNRSRD